MGSQRPNLTNLDPVFCKKHMSIWIRGKAFFFGPHIHFFGHQNWPFLGASSLCRNWGQFARIEGSTKGILMKSSHTTRPLENLTLLYHNCYCHSSFIPERLLFDTTVAGDDQSIMIMLNFEWNWRKANCSSQIAISLLRGYYCIIFISCFTLNTERARLRITITSVANRAWPHLEIKYQG